MVGGISGTQSLCAFSNHRGQVWAWRPNSRTDYIRIRAAHPLACDHFCNTVQRFYDIHILGIESFGISLLDNAGVGWGPFLDPIWVDVVATRAVADGHVVPLAVVEKTAEPLRYFRESHDGFSLAGQSSLW